MNDVLSLLCRAQMSKVGYNEGKGAVFPEIKSEFSGGWRYRSDLK